MKNTPACNGTHIDMFFPTAGMSIEPALKLCETCPAKEECRERELGHGAQGIWGGEFHGKATRCSKCRTLMVTPVGRRSVCNDCGGGDQPDPEDEVPYKPVVPGQCYHCDEPFEMTRPEKMFCSRTCQRRHNERPPAAWRGTVKVCGGCGNEFEMRRSTQVACSKECGRKMRNEKRSQNSDKMTAA